MKKFIRYGLASMAAVVAVSGIALSALAANQIGWGPSRPTFTMEKPATYVTFNSITNNNTEADERYFVSAKAMGGKWADTTVVENGKEYVVKMYVHNNAATNYNLVAENVRAYAIVPTGTGAVLGLSGKISASNAKPGTVWDATTFKSANGERFTLSYVPGSASYANAKDKKARNFKLSDDLATAKGVALGYDQMDGKMPGCIQYSGYVTYKVKANFEKKPEPTKPNYEISKEVQAHGDKAWFENIEMQAGKVVRYRIQFKNTGNVTLKNAVLKDQLPAGLSYIKGSSILVNANNPKGKAIADGITDKNGINIGDYKPAANAFVYFRAQVDENKEACQNPKTTLTNIVKSDAKYDVDTNNDGKVDGEKNVGEKEDSASVVVSCNPAPKKHCEDYGLKSEAEGNFTIKKEVKTENGEVLICYEEGQPIPGEVTTPIVPSLPKSGPESLMGSIVALSSMTMAGAYYIKSRKELQ